jgi:hypothetical protein
MHITQGTNKAFILLTLNLDHKSKTFTQDHNIKLVDFDLGCGRTNLNYTGSSTRVLP